MKISFLIGLLLLLSGCSNRSFMTQTVKSRYAIHVPTSIRKSSVPVPLLLVLHGNPSRGWQMQIWTGMNKTAEKHGFIVVYPDAPEKKWPVDPEDNEDFIQLISDLVEEIQANHKIDSERIYLSGISGGGIFSFQLIKALPDTFAAYCVVAGNLPIGLENISPKPFMYVHGTADFLWNGRDNLLSAEATLSRIVDVNNCTNKPFSETLPDTNKKDKSTVVKTSYRSEEGNDIVFYKVENGGHHWPGSTFNANLFHGKPLGPLNKDLDTNEAIWDFISNKETR
jgi:polyhydroxybutyrate depolymerase